MARVRLDLNNPAFLEVWFRLQDKEALAVLRSLRKITRLEWDQLYRDSGLKWEAILSATTSGGERLYSLRVSKQVRATAVRAGEFLRFISLHPDHDSTYQ